MLVQGELDEGRDMCWCYPAVLWTAWSAGLQCNYCGWCGSYQQYSWWFSLLILQPRLTAIKWGSDWWLILLRSSSPLLSSPGCPWLMLNSEQVNASACSSLSVIMKLLACPVLYVLLLHLRLYGLVTVRVLVRPARQKIDWRKYHFFDRVPSNINNVRLKMIRDLTAFPDKTNFDSDKLWFPSTACRLELYRLETVELRAWNREY